MFLNNTEEVLMKKSEAEKVKPDKEFETKLNAII